MKKENDDSLLNRLQLRFLNSRIARILPDTIYLKLRYRLRTGKTLNIKAPVSFNEKLQWLKIYDRKPEYTIMVDKYEAKKYVSNIIGDSHIIPTIGVWEKFDDIDFDLLPQRFVLKCTHDSGGLVIVKDKQKLDIEAARTKIEASLKRNYYWISREWPYKNVKPRIIAEEYMEDSIGNGLRDYKFYCFNGSPEFLYVSQGLENHSTARISFLNLDWTRAPFNRSDYREFEVLPDKPKNFEKMIDYATRLSQGMRFLRVDLYEIDNEVYFSELTFSPCSGYMPFNNSEWDNRLGARIRLKD